MVPGMCWRWWRCREAAGCWISCEVGLPKGLNVGCERTEVENNWWFLAWIARVTGYSLLWQSSLCGESSAEL